MKSIIDRRINKKVQKLNKEIMKNFNNRFFIKQLRKSKNRYAVSYYLYQFIDNKKPERVFLNWYNEFNIHSIYADINNFIIEADK